MMAALRSTRSLPTAMRYLPELTPAMRVTSCTRSTRLKGREGERLALGVAEQAAGKRGAGGAAADDVDQTLARLGRHVGMGQHGLGVGLNAHDEVVEIVRDAAGELAEVSSFLRLTAPCELSSQPTESWKQKRYQCSSAWAGSSPGSPAW